MKKLFSIILLALFYFNPVIADCYHANIEAYSTFKHARQAYGANNLDTCQRNAEKAQEYASNARYAYYAELNTSNCSCGGAETEAYSAYIYAENAYRADSLEICKRYARKTYLSALKAKSKAHNCN